MMEQVDHAGGGHLVTVGDVGGRTEYWRKEVGFTLLQFLRELLLCLLLGGVHVKRLNWVVLKDRCSV